jgi:hypothetical protein
MGQKNPRPSPFCQQVLPACLAVQQCKLVLDPADPRRVAAPVTERQQPQPAANTQLTEFHAITAHQGPQNSVGR